MTRTACDIVLERMCVRVWSNSANIPSKQYTDLQVCYRSLDKCLVIRQYSELCPTNAFIAYIIPVSSISLLASEVLSDNTRTIYLLMGDTIEASFSNDDECTHCDPSDISTLEMSCSLVDTSIRKADLMVPDVSKVSEDSLSTLLSVFSDCTTVSDITSDILSDNSKLLPTDSVHTTTSTSFTGEDLDWLSTRGNAKHDCLTPRHSFKFKQEPISKPPTTSHDPDMYDQILVENWMKRDAFWTDRLEVKLVKTPLPVIRNTTSRAPLQTRLGRQTEARKGWNGFAASNTPPGAYKQLVQPKYQEQNSYVPPPIRAPWPVATAITECDQRRLAWEKTGGYGMNVGFYSSDSIFQGGRKDVKTKKRGRGERRRVMSLYSSDSDLCG